MIISRHNAVPAATSVAQPAAQEAPAPPPQDKFDWGKALLLPAYAYGGGSAALSGLAAYADRFPPGGITINPGGIHRNPEWTRAFTEGSVMRDVQPIVAGVSAVLLLARSAAELKEGQNTAAALDLAAAITSGVSMIAPGQGALLTAGLLVGRALVEVHA